MPSEVRRAQDNITNGRTQRFIDRHAQSGAALISLSMRAHQPQSLMGLPIPPTPLQSRGQVQRTWIFILLECERLNTPLRLG